MRIPLLGPPFDDDSSFGLPGQAGVDFFDLLQAHPFNAAFAYSPNVRRGGPLAFSQKERSKGAGRFNSWALNRYSRPRTIASAGWDPPSANRAICSERQLRRVRYYDYLAAMSLHMHPAS
jgi:hypothetical protein